MIRFSNCKINLGLDIVRKRPDGYHDIESLFYPIYHLADAIEIVRSGASGVEFTSSGIEFDCPQDKNLCVRAYNLMREKYGIGGVKMHIHKVIPFGAGVGGGSSNAVTVLKLLDEIFGTHLTHSDLESLAAELGSDTIFFVTNTPAIVKGRGEIVEPLDLNLSGYHAVMIKPNLSVSTSKAYSGITPRTPDLPIEEIVKKDITQWKTLLKNDFEPTIFARNPQLAEIKQMLYDSGAIYASMSGSGSTIYGIFDHDPKIAKYPEAFIFKTKL